MENNKESFYQSLKENLDKVHQFPGEYTFKFILPNDHQKLSEVYSVFDTTEYTTSTKESAKSNYISVTVTCYVLNSDDVVQTYRSVGSIEGVIML